jgi:hypothetical protein
MLHSGQKYGLRWESLPKLPVYSCNADSVSCTNGSTQHRVMPFRLDALTRIATVIFVKREWAMQENDTRMVLLVQ